MMNNQLKEIRSNARKLHRDYLENRGLLSFIDEHTSDSSFSKFNLTDKIDYILSGYQDVFCYCGNRVKPGKVYCSAACTGRSPKTKKKLSMKQRDNASERYEKTKETWLKKYGVSHNLSDPAVQSKVKQKRRSWQDRTYRETFDRYGLDYNQFQDQEYLQSAIDSCVSLEDLSRSYFGGMPKMTIHRFLWRIFGKPVYEKTGSAGEKEMVRFIQSLSEDIEIQTNLRTIIPNRELDIYLPDYNLAIEYHGLYWHYGPDNKKIHLEKLAKCRESGIQLLQVFEDEWEYKQNIVKSIIATKLGYGERIYARKCSIREVDSHTRKTFLEETHLQGNIAGHSFGLYHDNELVSMFVVGKVRFKCKDAKYELLRYSTKTNLTVVGGFSKLLSHFKNIYNEPLLSFCDLRYSDGRTYEKFGKFLRRTSPNYFWYGKNKLSRYQTQKHKLTNILPNYDSSLTEVENMINHDYVQVWDVGNNVYLL